MIARRFGLALLALLWAGCPTSSTPSLLLSGTVPTYLWGIYKGCHRDDYLSGAVENRVYQLNGQLGSQTNGLPLSAVGGEVRRLLPRPAIENAAPEKAAVELIHSCGGSGSAPRSGTLLGGRVEEHGPAPALTVMHLWRVDLATQTISYRDHYCRGCDVARTLASQASDLLEHPGSPASAPPTAPTFCTLTAPPPLATPPLKNADTERVSLSIRTSEQRPRNPLPGKLQEALRQYIQLTGRDVVYGSARYALAVELAEGGAAAQLSLTLHSGQTTPAPPSPRPGARPGTRAAARPSPRPGAQSNAGPVDESSPGPSVSVSCPGCTQEVFFDRVTRAAGRLLDAAAATLEPSSATMSLPLLPAIHDALCVKRAGQCSAPAANLDSDPAFYPFFDPQCGEPLTDAIPSS